MFIHFPITKSLIALLMCIAPVISCSIAIIARLVYHSVVLIVVNYIFLTNFLDKLLSELALIRTVRNIGSKLM